MARSAASPASRCCVPWAACCRRTRSSPRCRRSAGRSCRAAMRRSGSCSSRATICRSAMSRRRRLGVDHVGLNCAVCHTGTRARHADAAPRIVLGMPAHQLDLQSFVEFVLECTLDSRDDRRRRSRASADPADAVRIRAAAAAPRARGPAQAADARAAQPDCAGARRPRAALGPRARRHVQSVQVDSVQLASRRSAARRS